VARVKKKPFPRIPRKSSKSKGTFPNPLHPKTGPTVQAIIQALIKTHGMQTKAAGILNCDTKTISNRIRQFPAIQEALEQAEAIRLDNAETRLDQNIENGNQKAIEFFLKNRGGSRGYGQNLKDKDDEFDLGKVVADWQAMLEAEKPSSFSQPSAIEVNPTG